jgi:DNA-directed RNA polymerase subunit alpha
MSTRYLSKPINELELTVRAARVLEAAHICTVGDLVTKTEDELLEYTFGRKALEEIKDALANMGLSLGMSRQKLEDT